MRIIISPAKKMNEDTEGVDCQGLPQFVSKTRILKAHLKAMSPEKLKHLWKCNNSIAALNVKRLRNMDLERNLTPAILAFEGLQYTYMVPKVFKYGEIDYVQEHLRILSGFYGLLKPLDGVVSYRLEMGAKLAAGGHKDLYGFWGGDLAGQVERESDLLLDLASAEYSKAVTRHLSRHTRVLKCVFAEISAGRLVQKGTWCKMARGAMVRFLAENRASSPDCMKDFCDLGYVYSPKHSTRATLTFLRNR